ncbi:MAG: hypothetical protein JNM18_25915 [Planctomycetaceae bacterium]|nr:hypothetical protein [Planctomycetaceae bacterium]
MSTFWRTGFGLAVALLIAIASLSGCTRKQQNDPPAQLAVVQELRKSAKSESAATTQVAATGTGWGTLKGRFVLDGAPGTPAKLDINKDIEVCGKHAIVDESLVVGPNNGLANVAVFLRNKTRVHDDVVAAAKTEVIYDNKGCRFEPHVLAVAIGQPVVIRNSDPVGHNSNGSPAGDKPFNPLVPADGGTYEYKFQRAQQKGVPVTCSIHPWMKGYILPRDNLYIAVTNDKGEFEIKNLPAGEELEIQLWHEKADNGLEADSKWPKGRQKLKVVDKEILDLGEIKVSAAAFK